MEIAAKAGSTSPPQPVPEHERVPATLRTPGAPLFWLLVVLTGLGAGVASTVLTLLLGAGALLAATTQGPVSATVLMMELTGCDRIFVAPLLLIVVGATLVARTIKRRSISREAMTGAGVR